MGILVKWKGEARANKDLQLLLLIGGLYSLSVALSNTFVNVYLWKQSGQIIDIAVYNLSMVLFQPITFVFAGRLAKKVDRIIVLRLGVSFMALFYLTVLIVGTRATDYLFLLGALLGIGYGFYWLAYNVLTFEITEPDTRDFFNGFLGALHSFGGMIGPILSGFIISRLEKFTGYSIVFGLSLLLFTIAVFLSFSLNRRPAHGKYFFIKVWKERKNNKNWNLITLAHFFQGLREGTFMFIISITIFVQTGSELALGSYGLLNSAVSFVAYFFVSRYIKQRMRKNAILIGGILLYMGVLLIAFDVTFGKLLVYGGIVAAAYPLLLVPYISLTYDIIGKAKDAAKMRIEYVVVRELFVHFGRIVSVVGFILTVMMFDLKQSLPIYLLIVGAGHMVIYWFIRKIDIYDHN
ncbi:MFS transporter [Peribacillus sp. NPDC097675]|uniref:MFS transporter n=1 Tax=Peribacillus sp. NPDC097675 TaxID=3390618 RepID=UPI003D00D8BD